MLEEKSSMLVEKIAKAHVNIFKASKNFEKKFVLPNLKLKTKSEMLNLGNHPHSEGSSSINKSKKIAKSF